MKERVGPLRLWCLWFARDIQATDLAHRKLEEAVFAAYGWEAALSDDEILARLLALNQERASEA